jgi:hypothetical protein
VARAAKAQPSHDQAEMASVSQCVAVHVVQLDMETSSMMTR